MIDLAVQISVGVMLAIIIGLMAYMTRAVVDVAAKLGILEKVVERIHVDLRDFKDHGAEIAVLKNNQENIKTELSILFEKLRDHEKILIHR